MNYMEQIAHMLGVELEEEFYLEDITDGRYITYDNDKTVFRLSNSGMFIKDKHTVSGWIDSTYQPLLGVLIGHYTIVKKPWKPKENEEYYWVDLKRRVVKGNFNCDYTWDVMRYQLGNCFRPEEEITPEVLEETWQKCYGAYFQDDKQDGAHQ